MQAHHSEHLARECDKISLHGVFAPVLFQSEITVAGRRHYRFYISFGLVSGTLGMSVIL